MPGLVIDEKASRNDKCMSFVGYAGWGRVGAGGGIGFPVWGFFLGCHF